MEQNVRGIVSLKPAGYIKPEGIVQLTEQGTHNVAQYEFAEVKTESTLKKMLDATKSCYYLFSDYTGTSVDDLISYEETFPKLEKCDNNKCSYCDNKSVYLIK
mgnify:CR=1 FL=1